MALNAAELLVVIESGGRLPLRARLTTALRDAVRHRPCPAGGDDALLTCPRAGPRCVSGRRHGGPRAAGGRGLPAQPARSRHDGRLPGRAAGDPAAVAAPAGRPPGRDPGPAARLAGPVVLPLAEVGRGGAPHAHLPACLPASDFGYTEPWGARALREQLSQCLGQVRGAMVDPESVLVVTGATQAISLTAQVLLRAGHRAIALEDPSNAIQRRLLHDLGLHVVDVPIDSQGLSVDVLAASPARAVICTPSHQYPTGVVLSAQRREQLCRWAEQRDAVILEDDYDSEFHYARPVTGCLQGLVPQHVALVGSVSKSLAPALRLGWVVAPPALLGPLRQAKMHADFGSGFLEQQVLAEFMASGAYDRNLRALRRRYAERRAWLVGALASRLRRGGSWVRPAACTSSSRSRTACPRPAWWWRRRRPGSPSSASPA